ncbi:Alpha/Beta hydrolase protein [Lasiosphaeria miniovina]|uniref:Alpha/Beta hydrolase protein n=1 Tax=Lasiosphaeria miniovina TaxID=1954250 RepID=A0AA40BIZ8_9PEZI|nr:Alpha/Beta hydrolase protein [Lasiosphaeria miniovina]KAK0735008.1 Alpha/Beta hydrolase protein [Lasiosphaeria miniovina]
MGSLASWFGRGASLPIAIAGTVAAVSALLPLLRSALWPTRPKIIPSPLSTVIPRLSKSELETLEYTPDAFPGARDVETPYGSIRVYEWGPESGAKVLFIHGISTSCQTLGKLAHALVDEKGCRVMMFDLFGRGFSDGVGDLPHDQRLYVTQALLALASSPLPWTGASAFKLVGYSLGGGVAVHFAATFPDLVSSLVLLAPAGLIRPESFGLVTRFVFTTPLIPSRLLAAITKRRLRRPIAASSKRKADTGTADPVSAALAEAADLPDAGAELDPLNRRVLRYVQWMVSYHAGFVPAFIGSIRDAPLVGQEAAWRKLGLRPQGSTAVILGDADEIIDPHQYAEDGLPLLGGRDHAYWLHVPGGHDFPMTHARETLQEMYKVWGL